MGPKREDITGAWTRPHNKDFRICTRSSNSIQVIKLVRWAVGVATAGERKGVYRVWWGKCEGKRPFGRYRRR